MNTLPEEIQKIINCMKEIEPTDEIYVELVDSLDRLVNIYCIISRTQEGDSQIFFINGGM